MRRTQISGEIVQGVMPDICSVWRDDHAVVGVEILDRGAPTPRIALPEDLLKIPGEQFTCSFDRSHGPPVNP
jgi:hypothetical protein